MKTTFVRTLLGLGAVLVVTLAPWQAHAASCSTASTAGRGAYTYTGTILTTSGLLPAASVGQFSQDAAGKHHRRSDPQCGRPIRGGGPFGQTAVGSDCTATATINVLFGGQLQRTAVLALVFDTGGNHTRGIFQSLTLPEGANVPVVLTIDANRLVPRD
jgi:hypothetical protein